MKIWRWLLPLLLMAGAAAAQPRFLPPGDVDVTYRLHGAAASQIPGGAPGGVRLRWDAASQRLRTEAVGGLPAYAITDLQNHTADIVFPGQSSILELPLRAGSPTELLAGTDARFTPIGQSRVLGIDCTEWTVSAKRLDARGCVTADGIVLRASGFWNGQPGEAIATAVKRGPQPEALFEPPAGFARVSFAGKR